MFDFLSDVVNAGVKVVTIPVATAVDVVTLGGVLTEKEVPYTVDAVENAFDAIDDIFGF